MTADDTVRPIRRVYLRCKVAEMQDAMNRLRADGWKFYAVKIARGYAGLIYQKEVPGEVPIHP